MNKTPKTLKGFRDFLPEEKRKRDWVLKKIIASFELFGFEPLETPTLEYADLLLGNYGHEADKLVYTFQDKGDRHVGLRYDQTVPSARVLGQYQNDLPKFFRRYQIQNVFRADKPQKGRFREFTQCDIDIFGSTSPLSDAEVLACTYQAFKNIGFTTVQININDRVSLTSALKPYSTDHVDVFSIIQTIDKRDKLSSEKISEELVKKGLEPTSASAAIKAVETTGPSDNLKQIIQSATQLAVPPQTIQFQPSLARGLDYYTGMIFEVLIDGYNVGSVAGGGRYDNLIKDLSGPNVAAVGVAFGFDRTVEAADQLGLIPSLNSTSQVLVTIFNQSLLHKSLETASMLREQNINAELYPASGDINKQFKLANQKGIPFVIIIGDEEASQNKVALKNMTTGDQQTLTLEEAITSIKTSHPTPPL